MKKYDYIVAGAGAAGLSLLIHMINSKKFLHKKILLVDRAPKNENDRTWCYWEKGHGLFEPVVYRKWSTMWFHGEGGTSRLHDISPYKYKLIRGIDYYSYCFRIINTQPNITVLFATIEMIESTQSQTFVQVDGERIYADYIFSSIIGNDLTSSSKYFLWQHFKGWFVHTDRNIFEPSEPVLMDFRINQRNETRFVYVMPFSQHDALVEYTVFSENKLSDGEYNTGLSHYCLEKLSLAQGEYEIVSEEKGMIPMTDHQFPVSDNNIVYIGVAGGQTKASSGYTFRFIQKHSDKIVKSLAATGKPPLSSPQKKFNFYDNVLLNILKGKKMRGAEIFTKLFESNSMKDVMKFLDNDTSLPEDIKLISSLPKLEFLEAAVSHLFQTTTNKKSSKL